MTVYVYELPGQRHTLFGRSPMSDPWFGLTARLGLTRVMFQPGTPDGPQQVSATGRYDVTEGERDQAIALGWSTSTVTQRDGGSPARLSSDRVSI